MNKSDDDFFRDFTDEEVEWYRLWFEFLKLSDKSKWTDAVARDFDIDFFNDESCGFTDWWPDHRQLFWKLKQPTIDVITSVEHYEACADDGSLPDFPPTVALFVHMWATKTELRAAFENILKQYHKGTKGRPEFDGFGDVYNFYARPDADMLKKTLAVYKAHIKPENQKMPMWRIEEEASKETPVIDKTSKMATYIWKVPESDLTPNLIDARRSVQYATVRRYLSCAEDILNNVVEGRFPVYTIDPNKESAD